MEHLKDEDIVDTDLPFPRKINLTVNVDEPLVPLGDRFYTECTRLVANVVDRVNLTGRVIKSSTVNLDRLTVLPPPLRYDVTV